MADEATDPALRPAIDKLLREKIIPAFQTYSVAEAGATKNNWVGTTVIGNYGHPYGAKLYRNLGECAPRGDLRTKIKTAQATASINAAIVCHTATKNAALKVRGVSMACQSC